VAKSMQCIGRAAVCVFVLLMSTGFALAQTSVVDDGATPFHIASGHLPLEIGALVQGGFGVTEDRGSFKFLWAGVHAGKVLTDNHGPGVLRGNFEYAVEVFPFWQSYTPKFQRETCVLDSCSEPYTVGGTFSGVSVTPIILRWNLVGSRRISPWVQGAGGLIWTNHKYPAFGGPPYNPINDGTNSDTSIWNFTPQFGVGAHYFIRPRRSIDFGANAVHISSASLGDKNPGVNASVQFSLGYTWWK
jgi:lipid A 3-O-deacylase